jgi:hypothetical protein
MRAAMWRGASAESRRSSGYFVGSGVLSSLLTIVRNAASRSAAVVVDDGGSDTEGSAGEDVVVVTGTSLEYLLRTIKPF